MPRAPRRCPQHGPFTGPQCRACKARRDARRGTTTRRGLGWTHQRARAKVLARQPWCSWCGETREQVEARGDKLTADHLLARSHGGTNELSNYVTACGRCNMRRGAG